MKGRAKETLRLLAAGAVTVMLGWVLGDLAPGPRQVNLGESATAQILRISDRTLLVVSAPNQAGAGPTCYPSVTMLPTGVARFEVLSYSFLFPRHVRSTQHSYVVDVTEEIDITRSTPQIVGTINGKEYPINLLVKGE